MSNTSARIGLPYIMAAQAQKHLTHNEALQRLDAVTQLVVEETDAVTPPALAALGDVYALGSAPSGDWTGQAGQLAYRADSGWIFVAPLDGWQAWDRTAGVVRVFQGGQWSALGTDLQNLAGLGIGTTSDTVNRLSVAADATLLSHDGAGHQLKLNKAAAGDTASLLYQSGFTGHAEMGLTGDNDFHVKVSADGNTWTEALILDAASGLASGAAVQATAQDTTPGRLARTDFTYGPNSLLGPVAMTAGMPSGAVIERGSNANGSYTRWADGTQMCVVSGLTFSEEAAGTRLGGGNWIYPAAFMSIPAVVISYGNAIGTHWTGADTHRRVSSFGCGAGLTAATTMRIFAINGSDFSTGAQASDVRLLAIGSWA